MFICTLCLLYTMSKTEEQEALDSAIYRMEKWESKKPNDDDWLYEMKVGLKDLVQEVLDKPGKRFRNQTDFIDAAIELYATWWTKPLEAQAFMHDPKKKPTIEQLAIMKASVVPQVLKNFMDATKTEITIQDIDRFLTGHPEYGENPKDRDPQEKARASKDDLGKLRMRDLDVKNFIENTNFEIVQTLDNQKEIKYDGWPLLSSYYSRLLPAKISIVAIADLMYQRKDKVIQLDETTLAYIYDIAEDFSTELRKIEKKLVRKRFEKYSTGLPKPFLDVKINATQALSEKRWKDRFIGKRGKGENLEKLGEGPEFFNGILSALGLARAFYDKDKKKVFLTLTTKGKKFYLYHNTCIWDILENNPDDDAEYLGSFESNEREFLLGEILPRLKLEMKLVKGAIKAMVDLADFGPARAEHLDTEFSKIVATFVDNEKDPDFVGRIKNMEIKTLRVATMGRLSEMGLVKWTIKDDTKSVYEIVDPIMAKVILKKK